MTDATSAIAIAASGATHGSRHVPARWKPPPPPHRPADTGGGAKEAGAGGSRRPTRRRTRPGRWPTDDAEMRTRAADHAEHAEVAAAEGAEVANRGTPELRGTRESSDPDSAAASRLRPRRLAAAAIALPRPQDPARGEGRSREPDAGPSWNARPSSVLIPMPGARPEDVSRRRSSSTSRFSSGCDRSSDAIHAGEIAAYNERHA